MTKVTGCWCRFIDWKEMKNPKSLELKKEHDKKFHPKTKGIKR